MLFPVFAETGDWQATKMQTGHTAWRLLRLLMPMNKVACLHSLDFHLGALKSRSFKHLRKDILGRSVGSYLMFRGIGFVSVYEI